MGRQASAFSASVHHSTPTAMLVYPRDKLLALRKLPHASERGSEERTGDVLPGGMPQLTEGIG